MTDKFETCEMAQNTPTPGNNDRCKHPKTGWTDRKQIQNKQEQMQTGGNPDHGDL